MGYIRVANIYEYMVYGRVPTLSCSGEMILVHLLKPEGIPEGGGEPATFCRNARCDPNRMSVKNVLCLGEKLFGNSFVFRNEQLLHEGGLDPTRSEDRSRGAHMDLFVVTS